MLDKSMKSEMKYIIVPQKTYNPLLRVTKGNTYQTKSRQHNHYD